MKRKNDGAVDQGIRLIRIFLAGAVLCGLLLLIAMQSRASANPQLQMLEFVGFILFIVVFAVALGANLLRIMNDDTGQPKIKHDEMVKVDTHQPHYQLTDDGEIMEVVDDEKPKHDQGTIDGQDKVNKS
jgi:hypothetical protein